MTPEIFRVTSDNATCLSRVDPEIFDAEIDPERVAAFVASQSHLMVVAAADGLVLGQIRGMIHAQPDGPNQLYIDNLGVSPSYQRRGIATLLLKELLSWGKENGCEDAWVATEPENDAARGLYLRFKSEPEQSMAYFQIDIE